MPTLPKEPRLFLLSLSGSPAVLVAARSKTEARTFLEEQGLLTLEQANPFKAHGAGALPIHYAKEEYRQDPDFPPNGELFGDQEGVVVDAEWDGSTGTVPDIDLG